jgi:hypothetical protein
VSSLTNVVMTEFRVRGAQILAQGIRASAAGVGTLYNRINEASRQSSVLNNQWRAIGTTIRYAIAGQAVFGLTRMIGQLREVQTQLGLIQAIASQPTPAATAAGSLLGGPLSTKQVDILGRKLQEVSLKTMAPISEVNAAAIQLYSTVSNVPPDQVSPMLEAIAKAATLSTTGVEDLTGSVLTLNTAFQRVQNPKNIQDVAQMWASMIALVPGGPAKGAEIQKQLGPVSTQFMSAPGQGASPRQAQAQMFALLTAVMRTGQTPSVAGRGLAYLLQAIATPRTEGQRKALATFGITPEVVSKEGVYNVLVNRFLPKIRYGGNVKSLAALSEEQVEGMETFSGLPPGQAVKLREAIGMIHGVRAAIILSSQLRQHGNVQSIPQDLQIMLGHMDEHTADVLLLRNQWDRFSERAKLKEAANALNLMSLQVAQVFEPVFNFIASGAITPLAKKMQENRGTTREVVIGGAAVLAALGGARFIRGGIPKAIGVTQGLQSIGGQPTGALDNPFYVWVLGNITGGGGLPGRGGGGVPPIVAAGGVNAARTGRMASIRAGASRIAGPVGVGLLATQAAQIGVDRLPEEAWYTRVLNWRAPTYGEMGRGILGLGSPFGKPRMPGDLKKIGGWLGIGGGDGGGRQAEIEAAQKAFFSIPAIRAAFEAGNVKMGSGTLDINVNVKQPDGTVETQRIHLGKEFFQNGRIPSFQGSPAARRSG